jgi:transposase-like protein
MMYPKNWTTGKARIRVVLKGGRMAATQRRYSGEFKARVALAAIQGERTMNE